MSRRGGSSARRGRAAGKVRRRPQGREAGAPVSRPAPDHGVFARARAWLRAVPHPLDAYLVSRGVLLLAGVVAAVLPSTWIPRGGMGYPLRPGSAEPMRAIPKIPWLDVWARWDSAWYGAIAREGYSAHAGPQSSVAFFPLYPMATKVVALPLRLFLPVDQAFYLAGILSSNAAFLIGLYLFFELGRRHLGAEGARRAVWLLCCFPFSFFFGAVYTESLFFSLSVASCLLARQGRWTLACIAVCAAGLTRNIGCLLIPALGLEYLRQRCPSWRVWPSLRSLGRQSLAFLIAPLGTLAYAGYLWVRFGDPLKFMHTQAAWGHKLALPAVDEMLAIVQAPLAPPHVRLLMATYLAFMVVFPLLALVALRRFGPGLGLFAIGAVAAPLFAGVYLGMGRYMAVVFPAFLVLAQLIRDPRALRACCATGLAMGAVYVVYFAHWWPPV